MEGIFCDFQSINDRMTRVAPVLSSKFAKYPIQYSSWLDPFTQTSDGKPTFMPQEKPPKTPPHEGDERYMDYIWGEGPCGKGYYHLLTKQAYRNLINELENETPVIRCDCFVGDLGDLHDHMEVISLLRHRSESNVPNDFEIARKFNDALVSVSKPSVTATSTAVKQKHNKAHARRLSGGILRKFTKNDVVFARVQQPLEP